MTSLMAMFTIPQTLGAHYAIGGCGLAASCFLMYGLSRMSVTTTSAYGIRIAGAAMLVAVLAGLLYVVGAEPAASAHLSVNLALAVSALVLGGGTAWWRVRKAALTTLPQLSALFNGIATGAAAVIVSLELFTRRAQGPADLVVTLIAALLAGISLTGSSMAWAKLGGIIDYTLRVAGRRVLLGALLLAAAGLGLCIVRAAAGDGAPPLLFSEWESLIFGCGLLCGLLATLPIRAAHMPVAVMIFNALSALAVALVGILLRMPVLTVVGIMAAAAGLRLAQLRARSMNRSLIAAVLKDVGTRERRALDAGDAAIFLNYARKIIVVPGYGLAAAQGQHKLHELIKLLLAAGVDVKVAQHPMAGRMPGQMAAMLAEAHVADDLILPFPGGDDAFRGADIALVIGANDVVNPSANLIKSLPMFGMPFLDAGMARKIFVVKRGAGAGYSGIENPAFDGENCSFIYGDAQTVLIKMLETLRVAEFPRAA